MEKIIVNAGKTPHGNSASIDILPGWILGTTGSCVDFKNNSPFEGGRGMFLLLVILNEVKNLFCGLTFCYDAILHFVQNVP